MTESNSKAPARSLVWERVKEAARSHHKLTGDRGINKLIAIDAETSPQYVSDWKAERSPIPMASITKLAAKYGRSATYLAGYTDEPAQVSAQDSAAMRAEMVRLVEDVLKRLNPNASPFLVIQLCDMALEMLQSGETENAIIGALYKRLSDTPPEE